MLTAAVSVAAAYAASAASIIEYSTISLSAVQD